MIVFVVIVVGVVVVAQSTSAQQTLSEWGLTAVCDPINLGGGDSTGSVRDRSENLSSHRASAAQRPQSFQTTSGFIRGFSPQDWSGWKSVFLLSFFLHLPTPDH